MNLDPTVREPTDAFVASVPWLWNGLVG